MYPPKFPYTVTTRKAFWEFALSIVSYSDSATHRKFLDRINPDKKHNDTCASFWISCTRYTGSIEKLNGERIPKNIVHELEISINLALYPAPFIDLIPYAVEHEIYECWCIAKNGINVSTEKHSHLLARRHQYRQQIKNGHMELDFQYTRFLKSHIGLKDEFFYAYEKATKIGALTGYKPIFSQSQNS